MISREKIDEWLKEVEQRPSSAPVILQFIANRLRDLTVRNEALQEELIALQSEKKVEQYERRIAHLEYQLDILKRKIGAESGEPVTEAIQTAQEAAKSTPEWSVLIYSLDGRLAHLGLRLRELEHGRTLVRLDEFEWSELDKPRICVAAVDEELMFVFSSGRIATLPVRQIPFSHDQGERAETDAPEVRWPKLRKPIEPQASEQLAGLTPISGLALAEHFLQISRKGYMKKIHIRMAESILQKRYIGAGVKKPPDQIFEVLLCSGGDRLACVSREGYSLLLEAASVPTAIEEMMRLSASDHLVSAFRVGDEVSILVMTSPGKAVHIGQERMEPVGARSKGQAVFSAARRAQGVQVVGAAPARDEGWGVVLDQRGWVQMISLSELAGSGTLPEGVIPIAFNSLPSISDSGL